MIQSWLVELTHKFINIELDEFIIMPNHMHGIIVINNVGADLRVCPDINNDDKDKGEHTGSPLHKIVQWFKTMTTNEYIRRIKLFDWHSFNGKLWQRNYYEHIIRNERGCTPKFVPNCTVINVKLRHGSLPLPTGHRSKKIISGCRDKPGSGNQIKPFTF